ncbi:hypothetical protein [Streptomyces sp. Isolate_219]|nr:hypothetical protein [Streptomyces sp. Isolate_219]
MAKQFSSEGDSKLPQAKWPFSCRPVEGGAHGWDHQLDQAVK